MPRAEQLEEQNAIIFGPQRAKEIRSRQVIDYIYNPPVFLGGSVSLDFEFVPERKRVVKTYP